MAQAAKVIEITKTFIPVDPNAYPDTRGFTGKEDYPHKEAEVAAYEGYNFMPTPHGYKSYFGTNAALGFDTLASRVDRAFIIQTNEYENILIALCEDGIWTKRGDEAGAWTQDVTLDIPEDGVHYNWSYCTIGKDVFMYRAGEPLLYRMKADPILFEVDSFVGATTTSVVATAMTGGLAAGSYKVKVAYEKVDGSISAPGNEVSITLTVPSATTISFTRVAAAVRYRVYITTAGQTYYYVKEQTAAATQVQADQGPTFSAFYTVVTLPDDTWLPLIQTPAYTIISETPSFLNMAGQVGIFRAGIRLGFWDSEDSVSWSSIDDFTDFTPSITSLAGNAIFSDVVGRITNILSQEDGFVIYATKSIVLVRRNLDTALQWNPKVLLSGAGVAFAEEATQSFPDSTHFAYASTGLYKIAGGVAEILVPEVVEYLKEMQDPVMLKVMQGRYICLQIIDPTYIDGLVATSVNLLPPQTYVFPADLSITDLEVTPGEEIPPADFCYNTNAFSLGNTAEQQAAAAAAVVSAGAPAKMDGTLFTPVFTANFSSSNALDPENINWTNTPCATVGPSGTEYNLSPGNVGTLDNIGADLTGKITLTGSQWNIDTFVATQLAIWDMGDSKREAFLAAVVNRAATDTGTPVVTGPSNVLPQSVEATNVCPASSPTIDDCTLGSFISAFSDPHYGLNSCSFWLTRYAIEASTVVRRTSTVNACDRDIGDTYYGSPQVGGTYGSLEECIAAILAVAFYPQNNGLYRLNYRTSAQEQATFTWADMDIWNGSSYTAQTSIYRRVPVTRTVTPTMNAFNLVTDRPSGVLGVDTGWLEQTGWEYTDVDGIARTISAPSACTRPDAPATPPSSPSTSSNTGGIPVSPTNGTICGTPFTPILIPELDPDPIEWSSTLVTIPAASFLLQDGSVGPIYPTYTGMLVYDLQLKKWGKMKQDFKVLLDYSPLNEVSGNIIPYETFGMEAGCIKGDGYVYLFDQWPENSYIKYGKIGYYRLGMTDLEEVRIDFRTGSTGTLRTETSLNSRDVEIGLTNIIPFTDATQIQSGFNTSGRWHNIIVEGQYDITAITFVGVPTSRR